ncbi:glycosyltransferase [Paenibacillus sp. GCM10023248]|uniref:glycosyltransferase n=1 Tax=unclassified Paenibacillus TaxID=185978 RepID=UPI002377DD2B|nr:glycosyltransferase [Paenibacillus sp. MAHUQ-63]MDD9266623.1 glycosyltransferase [Paenibacillus sp. MAHUQ-63]
MMEGFDYRKSPGRVRFERNVINDGVPLVSIVTPYYHANENFMETVNSVLNQTFPYFEWLIVNDGSTNEKDIDLLNKVEALDSRILVLHTENGGISKARNLAIKKSNTEIIIPLDADDLIEPTYVECIYWTLYTNPEASWSYTDCVGFHRQEYLWKQPFTVKRMKYENLLTCTAGIRKSVLFEVGLYNETEKHYNEDWNLWLRLLGADKIPVHMGWYGFWYRRTDSGILNHVNSSKEAKYRSKQIISEAARGVNIGLEAIEFPRYKAKMHFSKPNIWEWNRPPLLGNEKTKVLMLLPHMEMGGADVFNLDIVSKINKEEFEMSIIVTNPADSTWRQRFEDHVIDLFDLTKFLDINQWASFIHYFIKSRDIDILFLSNSYYGYYLIPWLRKHFPNLIILDYVHMEEWYWRSGGYARTSGALGDVIEKTYVCNEHLRQVLIQSFNKQSEKVETLYIGVDEEEFNVKNVKGNIHQLLGIPNNRKIVLFPCRIHPQKRPFLMLKIAKLLRAKLPDVAFVVVGDGPQLEELELAIRKEELNQTVFCVGRQSELSNFYSDAEVTLICSLKEGLSLTSYESLAMGVPVVSSDVGGQKELISNEVGRILPLYQDETRDLDNRNFANEEIELYVNALHEVLTLDGKEKECIRKACRERIEQGFTKKHMISKLEDDFRSWMDGKGKEKRKEISNALRLLPNLVDDYVALYCEYEVNIVMSNRAVQLVQYLKTIIRLQKSPIAILRDFKRLSSRYFMQRAIARLKVSSIAVIMRRAKNAIFPKKLTTKRR